MVGCKTRAPLPYLYLLLVLLFLYAPIGVLVVFSFNNLRSTSVWAGYSLRWYRELFQDRQILQALYYTVTIALLSSIISAAFGTVAAIGIYRMHPIARKLILAINNVPVLNPDVPHVVLCILPRLRQIPREVTEAAMDLGATLTHVFFHVILPEIRSAILMGFLIAFTLSVDDFVSRFFTTGRGVNNLPIVVYSMARRGIHPKINAVSTLLFVTVFCLLLIINKRDTSIQKLEV